MNDDDVLTAVRDCLTAARDSHAAVRMQHPAEAIRAQVTRRRRRRGLAAGMTTLAAVALGVTMLLPRGGLAPAKLTAWTVSTRPGGQVIVTIRQLRDPAGLQQTLRAHGVPATVRFTNHNPPDCLYYPLSPAQGFRLQARIFPRATSGQAGTTAFTINTPAIPPRIGLWITVSPAAARPSHNGTSTLTFSAGWTLIYASGQCPQRGPAKSSFEGGGVVGTSG